jgi:hypothetical protein
MNTQTTQNMERNGKIIAIVGVILFGASLIAHLYYKGRLSSISATVNSIEFEIQTQPSLEIRSLEGKQKSCEDRSPLGDPAFFGCDSASINKRAAKIADLKAQRQSRIEQLQKPLPALYQQGDREHFNTQAFFYSSIITFAITVIGILLIFGRSLAFINRGGDISIGDVHNSKLPINSGQENTAIAGDTISDISVENYSNSVKNSISHLPANSDLNTEELRRILAQIQELITQAPEIGNDKKLMALEQVKVLAESSANPTNPNKRKVADQAMMILKGIASSLPDAAKLTDSLSKLLTSVSSLLGLL